MFTKLAICRHFGRRLAGAAAVSPAFSSDGRANRRCREGAHVRRQNTVICHWQINTATGKPEQAWSVVSIDKAATRDLDDAPAITPALWGVDTWITPAAQV